MSLAELDTFKPGGTPVQVALEMLKRPRLSLLGTLEPLSEEQLLTIPSGFNNILWERRSPGGESAAFNVRALWARDGRK